MNYLNEIIKCDNHLGPSVVGNTLWTCFRILF